MIRAHNFSGYDMSVRANKVFGRLTEFSHEHGNRISSFTEMKSISHQKVIQQVIMLNVELIPLQLSLGYLGGDSQS